MLDIHCQTRLVITLSFVTGIMSVMKASVYFQGKSSLKLRCLQCFFLAINLPKPKLISLCHQYRARPVSTICSLSRLYTDGWPTSSSHQGFPLTFLFEGYHVPLGLKFRCHFKFYGDIYMLIQEKKNP